MKNSFKLAIAGISSLGLATITDVDPASANDAPEAGTYQAELQDEYADWMKSAYCCSRRDARFDQEIEILDDLGDDDPTNDTHILYQYETVEGLPLSEPVEVILDPNKRKSMLDVYDKCVARRARGEANGSNDANLDCETEPVNGVVYAYDNIKYDDESGQYYVQKHDGETYTYETSPYKFDEGDTVPSELWEYDRFFCYYPPTNAM